MISIKKKIFCRLCENNILIESIDLGNSPIANDFLNSPSNKKTYPLKVLRCANCNHLQLSHVIHKKKLFSKYLFLSGVSSTNVEHFKRYAIECTKRFIKKKSKILDIACNDATFLNFFDKNKIKVGIDPANNILPKNNLNNFFFENKFFSFSESKKLKKKYGKFDLITANNVCAHVDDLHDFVKGVKNLLKIDGVFIFEVGYFYEVYKKKTFDTIYHEHLDYHLFIPLISFFHKMGMEIFDVKNIPIQGGSLRIYISHLNQKIINKKNINKIIKNEKKINYSNQKIYTDYQDFINNIKKQLKSKIKILKSRKYKIAGYGASAKSTTLLNYFKITNKHLDFIADLNKLKQSKYSPGSNIKILSPNNIYVKKVDYLLILSWNFSKEIILQNINFLHQGGKFIIPYPKIITIGKTNFKKIIKYL
jgi:SAM-dependent methyltransferase